MKTIMAKLVLQGQKIGADNPLLRIMLTKERTVYIGDKPHTLIGICRNRVDCMLKPDGTGEKAFKIAKSEVVKAIQLTDARVASKLAEEIAQRESNLARTETKYAGLRKAANLVDRHRLPPPMISAAPSRI